MRPQGLNSLGININTPGFHRDRENQTETGQVDRLQVLAKHLRDIWGLESQIRAVGGILFHRLFWGGETLTLREKEGPAESARPTSDAGGAPAHTCAHRQDHICTCAGTLAQGCFLSTQLCI